MANVLPLLLGAGAVYYLMRGKNGAGTGYSGESSTDSGFGTDPCSILEGIWASSSQHNPWAGAISPLADVTSDPALLVVNLTPDAFAEAKAYLIGGLGEGVIADQAVLETCRHLTANYEEQCPWGTPSQVTDRMKAVWNGVEAIDRNLNPGNWA